MTSMELNQELFRQLAVISGNEDMMRKAVKALKRIIGKAESTDATGEIMSSPEMVEILRKGDEEIARGNLTPMKFEDLWK